MTGCLYGVCIHRSRPPLRQSDGHSIIACPSCPCSRKCQQKNETIMKRSFRTRLLHTARKMSPRPCRKRWSWRKYTAMFPYYTQDGSATYSSRPTVPGVPLVPPVPLSRKGRVGVIVIASTRDLNSLTDWIAGASHLFIALSRSYRAMKPSASLSLRPSRSAIG